jgi:hypothetical protein
VRKYLLMATAVVSLAAPAHASEMTGGQLQSYCASSDSHF